MNFALQIIYLASLKSIHTIRWINFFSELDGYDITCISFNKKNRSINKNIKINQLNGLKFFSHFLRSFYKLSSPQKGLIHVHYLGWNSLLLLLAHKSKKIILTPWGSDLYENQNNFLKRIWLKYIFSRCSYIICDSSKLVKTSRKLGFESDKARVIAFGTNTLEYKSYREPFKSKENQKSIKIGTNRGMETIYDHFTFLKAVNILKRRNKNFKFIIANEGSLKSKIENFIRDNNLEKIVELVGIKHGKANIDFYNSIDIYVSTALRDGGLSASIAEAMSCKRLVIVSDNSDNSKFINHGISGYLFQNKDFIELANLIEKAASNKTRSLKIADEGRNIILKKCNYHLEMKKVSNLYKKISDS